MLLGLSRLTAGDADAADLHALASDLLSELNDKTIGPDQYSLVKRSLERATELQQGGKSDEARLIWQSIVDLYSTDPDAANFVEQARRGLAL